MATVEGAKRNWNKFIWETQRKVNGVFYSRFKGDKTQISIMSQNCTGGIDA